MKKKYFEVECDPECKIKKEYIEDGISERIALVGTFTVREVPDREEQDWRALAYKEGNKNVNLWAMLDMAHALILVAKEAAPEGEEEIYSPWLTRYEAAKKEDK